MMIVCDELSCSKFVHEFLNLIFLVLLGKTVSGQVCNKLFSLGVADNCGSVLETVSK